MEASSIEDETVRNQALFVLSSSYEGVSRVQGDTAKESPWNWHCRTSDPGFGLEAVDRGTSVHSVLVIPSHDHHVSVGQRDGFSSVHFIGEWLNQFNPRTGSREKQCVVLSC